MNKRFTAAAGIILAASIALTATACDTKVTEREAKQAASQTQGESLEIKNLKAKRDREENPSTERYLYVMSFGKIIGYYVTKGKISSNGSQIGPELELANRSYRDSSVLDSAQDDGSYGDGDPGIFFFTSDGTMVVTNLDYIQSDAPLDIDVPRLRR
jgi:hypothetical protein